MDLAILFTTERGETSNNLSILLESIMTKKFSQRSKKGLCGAWNLAFEQFLSKKLLPKQKKTYFNYISIRLFQSICVSNKKGTTGKSQHLQTFYPIWSTGCYLPQSWHQS